MTKRRVTISVPPDVAETLAKQGERKASAYVTAAIRGHRAWEQFRAEQERRGITLTRQGLDAARARRYAAQTDIDELYAALEAQVHAQLAGDSPDRPASAAA